MNIVPVTLAPLTGEVLPTGAGVRVIGKTHPLNGGEIERYLDAGTTIGEMLEETRSDRPDFLDRNQMIVHIDGDPIETCNWHRIRAKPGTTVTFVPRLQGGAIWRTVLAVMVVAATVFAAPRPACHGLAAAVPGIWATVAGALIGAGIVPAGKMACDALFREMRRGGVAVTAINVIKQRQVA